MVVPLYKKRVRIISLTCLMSFGTIFVIFEKTQNMTFIQIISSNSAYIYYIYSANKYQAFKMQVTQMTYSFKSQV